MPQSPDAMLAAARACPRLLPVPMPAENCVPPVAAQAASIRAPPPSSIAPQTPASTTHLLTIRAGWSKIPQPSLPRNSPPTRSEHSSSDTDRAQSNTQQLRIPRRSRECKPPMFSHQHSTAENLTADVRREKSESSD